MLCLSLFSSGVDAVMQDLCDSTWEIIAFKSYNPIFLAFYFAKEVPWSDSFHRWRPFNLNKLFKYILPALSAFQVANRLWVPTVLSWFSFLVLNALSVSIYTLARRKIFSSRGAKSSQDQFCSKLNGFLYCFLEDSNAMIPGS